ncbi:MAG TPA: efflux RND transporter permease subunit [Burkholderiales bacterium]|nr:efflux RND transporter permease subunit [Burkholderiales bacterium]
MTLPELSIRRHVLAVMLNAVLVLFGIIAYQRMGIDKLPYIEFPVISVQTNLKGANPEVLDASVTNLIEGSVNTVPGIEHIQSTSTPGISNISITFDLGKNIDVAFNEVQAKVNQVLRRLPQDADPPVISKVETNASPIFWMTLWGDRTQQQLNQYAINVIKKKLETIDGVGEVRIGGRRDRTIRVNLLPTRMAAFNITAQDLNEAFQREHLQLAGGFLVGGNTESLVKLDLEFHKLDDLANMIVGYRDRAPIRLRDVAEIEDGLTDFRQLARFNTMQTVGVGIIKIANTNTVEITDKVLRRLEEDIRPELPPGMNLTVIQNDAIFINEMVDSLKNHLIEGTILAALIVLFFLRSLRSTLIIAIAIPVSLTGAVAIMYFFGYTFNSVTLLALLLLVGVVVDDAIVVLENIFRHREHLDADPITAAMKGSREVTFAVLAATLSLICIFAPVIFIGDIIGQFFKSFAVVVTCGVIVSWFVSLTLTPMLCSRFLKVETRHGRLHRSLDRFFERLDNFYRRILNLSLGWRWPVMFIAVALVPLSLLLFSSVDKELAPVQDEGRIWLGLRAPIGSSIHYTSEKLAEAEQIVQKYPEIDSMFGLIGVSSAQQVNQATLSLRMKARLERAEQGMRSQQEVVDSLRKDLAHIAGVKVFPRTPSLIPRSRSEPLQFVVTGPGLQEMGRYAEEMQRVLQNDPDIGRMDTDLQLDLPQIVLRPDRTRAQAFGLSAQDVALALNMLTGGLDIAKYNDDPSDGQRYDIRIKAKDGEFAQQSDLSKIYLRNRDGQLIRLDSVAQFSEVIGPGVIGRFDLQYAASFYATPTVSLGEAVDKVRSAAEQILPLGYGVQFVGEAEELGKIIKDVRFAFAVGCILLFMVLASQFNSFLQPLIIMLAVPLAVVGGIFALWLSVPLNEILAWFGGGMRVQTLNIYSMIGLILLIGLAAKNSILLVDLSNQRRAEGMDVDTALRDACPTRLRPVLMTSFTIILALLPAAMGFGAGSETNQPLAVAVIGGMITSTLLTLVVIPAAYSLMLSGELGKYFRRPPPPLEADKL